VLCARAKGIQGNWSKGGKNKRLIGEEEATLVCYCERRILANDPPEREHITAAANSILRAAGKKHVSKQWVTRWIKAHPDLLRKRKTKPLYAERKAVHEVEDIEAHFRRFEAAKKEYNIKDENIWNVDETGWRIGCLNGRVVFTFPDVSAVYMSSPETRESVTLIECISATGSYIPGFLILPGQLLLEGQFDNDIHPDCIFATNKETGSGFTNDILAIDWLEHFELHTRPGTKT
jgi:hypothetical protein